MRLIDTQTGRFVEFFDLSKIPPYAVLSHTWEPEPVGEQSYQEVVEIQRKFNVGHGLSESQPPVSEYPSAPVFESPSAPVSESPSGPLPDLDATDSESAHQALKQDEVVLPQPPTSISRISKHRSSWIRRICSTFLRRWNIPHPKQETQRIHRAVSSLNQGTGILTDSDLPTTVSDLPTTVSDLPTTASVFVPEASTPCPSPSRSIWDRDSGLSDKVRRACEIARRDGYRYVWIDSCCIDKTSSSELSEAINSMFNWYQSAQVCYAFLSDVQSDEDVRADGSEFRESRWFSRAWTLQELIAPRVVVFFSQTGALGTKDALADLIQEITYIDCKILTHEKELARESIAQRMRWASRREATRVEDKAYSLLGIFGITMPTLYGEGAYAFRRLQEEILQRIPDQSLFAWGSACLPLPQDRARITIHPQFNGADEVGRSSFAPSPHSFDLPCGRIIPASGHDFESLALPVEEYTPTPHGIRTRLCFVPLQDLNPKISVTGFSLVRLWYLVILGSQCADDRGRLLAKLCYLTYPKSNVELLHVPDRIALSQPSVFFKAIIFAIPLTDLAHAELQQRTVYLPHPKPSTTERRLDEGLGSLSKLSLAAWTRDALQPYGFTISNVLPTSHDGAPDSYSLMLSGSSFDVHIRYRHMLIYRLYGTAIVIQARVWISSFDRRDVPVDHNRCQHYTPYTSAVWADRIPCSMTLPLQTVRLVTPSGDEVTLQLGLGLTAPSQYHVRVDIATDSAVSQRTSTHTTPDGALRAVMQVSHADLTFTLLGSVKQALEMQGYSVVVEETSRHTSQSCALSIFDDSDPGFKVTIKYFHMLQACPRPTQELIVVARITLESSQATGAGLETYQDGPYVVAWTDFMDWASSASWRWSHGQRQVMLTTQAGDTLKLRLGLDLAWQSEYYVLVDIERYGFAGPNPLFQDEPNCGHGPKPCFKPGGHAPRNISLTLPGHVKRALQVHGYEVHFERAIAEDLPAHYHLILSDAYSRIDVEYSYHRSTASDGQEKLTFRVHVEALASPTAPDDTRPASERDARMVEWDAWDTEDPEGDTRWSRQGGGCCWNLPRKEVSLILPSGRELTLRLGFYLVWLPEYCLTVEVGPQSQPAPCAISSTSSASARSDDAAIPDSKTVIVDEADDQDLERTGIAASVASPSGDGKGAEMQEGHAETKEGHAETQEGDEARQPPKTPLATEESVHPP
ncbi:hypothetical protein GSI_08819 [Ganoderma sinense ZZ0214-1]|uniref:Uncharacterized protein n=1 Tax=Ganoderma sinense ZZ0214-1 TaxID=1077348 RepID=A0A2G8S4V4_9APHY|nr:hypothetical protein GSI_08819 [Ganoderma sinense ZZ0214-1]